MRWLRYVAVAVLLGSTLVFVLASRSWPLVGDASLIHYLCFLMDHGFRPYRDLGDMNMPGSFLVEWSVMHTLGGGPVAWRTFDLLLLGVAAVAMGSISTICGAAHGGERWFGAIFAACLLALIHGRDGMGQLGQRDLTMAISLLVATAFLFEAERRTSAMAAAMFGLFAGLASTIKPTALPFGAVLLLLFGMALRRRGASPAQAVAAAVAGYGVAPGVALGFLLRLGVLGAFVRNLRTLVPFYASLGHRPLGFLLLHSISPLLPMVLLWISMLLAIAFAPGSATNKSGWMWCWQRLALGCGVGFGVVSYVVQARGFPYYRYPLLVFLLPLMTLDLLLGLRWGFAMHWRGAIARRTAGWMAAAGLLTGALVIAPTSAWLIARYDPTNLDFITSLEQQLDALGGAELSGHVQCVDSISGCGTTLYRMRLVQSTGVLSDFLLFGPAQVAAGEDAAATPIVRETRAELMRTMERAPPWVLVISSYLHIDGPDGYAKLERWPAFQGVLERDYRLQTEWRPTRSEHWWSRQQMPKGYRIYVLRSGREGRKPILPRAQEDP